jgi:hypothetical protein
MGEYVVISADDGRRPTARTDRFARSLQIVLLAAGLFTISWESLGRMWAQHALLLLPS